MKQKKDWNKFECKDGSIYFWKYDDGRIAVKTGLDNIVWLNLQILQFLAAELSLTNKIYCTMPDNSESWLTLEKPFQFMRGKENKNKIMGFAKDKEGIKYTVRVASCSLPTCYCAAKAEPFTTQQIENLNYLTKVLEYSPEDAISLIRSDETWNEFLNDSQKGSKQELEKELSEARRIEYEQKRRDNYKKEQEFKAKENINLYTSSDYAGLENGKYSFYYGYEHTRCLVKKHGVSCVDDSKDTCEDAEWCFVVTQDNKEILRMVQSQLWWETGETPFFYLLAGIGHFLKKVSD